MGAYNNDPDYTKTPYELDSIPGNTLAIGVTTNPFCAPPLDLYVESLNQDVAVYNSMEGNGQYIAITAKKAGTATFRIYAQASSANTDTVEYTETTKDVTVTITEPPYKDDNPYPKEVYLSIIKNWTDIGYGGVTANMQEVKDYVCFKFKMQPQDIDRWLNKYKSVTWNKTWHNQFYTQAGLQPPSSNDVLFAYVTKYHQWLKGQSK